MSIVKIVSELQTVCKELTVDLVNYLPYARDSKHVLTIFFLTFSGAYNRAVLTFERCLQCKRQNIAEGNLKIFANFDVKFNTFCTYFLIILNLELYNAIVCHLFKNKERMI